MIYFDIVTAQSNGLAATVSHGPRACHASWGMTRNGHGAWHANKWSMVIGIFVLYYALWLS